VESCSGCGPHDDVCERHANARRLREDPEEQGPQQPEKALSAHPRGGNALVAGPAVFRIHQMG